MLGQAEVEQNYQFGENRANGFRGIKTNLEMSVVGLLHGLLCILEIRGELGGGQCDYRDQFQYPPAMLEKQSPSSIEYTD